MPVPSAIANLSTTPGSNSPSGGESPALTDDYLRTLSAFIKTLDDTKLAAVPDASVSTAKIVDGAVTTPKLAANAVTFAKMQDIATARFLGRTTAGSGDVEELTGRSAQSLLPISQPRVDVTAASAIINLTADAPNTDHINITSTGAIIGFTVAAGRLIFAKFSAAGGSLIAGSAIALPFGDFIICEPGDTFILRATAANVVEVLGYVAANPSTIRSGVAVTLTTQTAVDFTGIPASAKRITVMMSEWSTNGTSSPIIQLGDSGGFEVSGYLGGMSSSGTTNNSTGFLLTNVTAAANVCSTNLVLTKMDGNRWSCMVMTHAASLRTYYGAGDKLLSDVLTQIRLTTVNGTDQFDAGLINIAYE